MDSLREQLNGQIVQGCQPSLVGLGGGPGGEQLLHPTFGLKRAQNLQPLFLVANLLQLLPAGLGREVFDDAFFFGVNVASAGLGVHLPAEAREVARGANQQGWLFKETVIGDQAKGPRLDVRSAVHGVHQQSERAFVERDRHGVDGEVAAAKLLLNGSGMIDRLAGLRILNAVRADQVNANRAGKT